MTQDPIEDALTEEHRQEVADEAARLERQTEIGDLKWVLSNKRGRRHVWRLLEQAGVFRTSFTPDPCTTAFNEGARNQGLRVLALVHEHAPESYALMLSESNDRHRDRNDR